ncbi:Tetratricopeptide repeat,FKBP-type peptidyl-prolyl cis-trans isomerase domain,Tetratricopeptide repeat- [Cinara cedri]|uniref:Tetratricopeptide repeat,FKBP-type peptidyl-prolyl cis-trans isomerase domain,Tetratricopeptide repeat n=1 Tax=Cinara cedri TaxID=506608 RepID=A0A5E4NS41_9HEMI|nr:Tetratricopeptide repeat,FKBP-type peptidyl-prolyl cis-trans isomerase domain,Tetratricopeptide repeat- [Cinara cedri]
MESINNDKIQKILVTPGIGGQPTFSSGSKVSFHFITRIASNNVVVDNSYLWPKHMEIVLGKKFKLEVWEIIIKSMCKGEISKFIVNKCLIGSYPFISKTLRDAGRTSTPSTSHCCTAQLQKNGTGYDDLNNLLAEPTDLEFTIELLKIEEPGTFEKETWLLDENEKRNTIPELKEAGNEFYHKGMYKEAEEKYMLALGFLEQIMIKLKPREKEWNELNNIKTPLLLNLAQCKLISKEYYQVIEHCTSILDDNPDNVKALFRRGKANISVWKMNEAREDLKRLSSLDPSMQVSVNRLLCQINEAVKKKDDEDRQKLRGKLF